MDLYYRMARPDDAKELTDLAIKEQGIDLCPDYWHWKYFDNPFGRAGLALAIAKQKIIGHSGEFSLRFYTSQGKTTGHYVGDQFISQKYRSGGTVFKLINTLAKWSAEQGRGGFLYGRSTPLTLEVDTTILGFCKATSFCRMVKLLNPLSYLGKKFGMSRIDKFAYSLRKIFSQNIDSNLHNWQIQSVNHFDSRFDQFWEKIPKTEIMPVKDCQYLNWRYINIPGIKHFAQALIDNRGIVHGLTVFHLLPRNKIKYGILDELLVPKDTPEAGEHLLKLALFECTRLGADCAFCRVPKNSSSVPILLNHGFKMRNPLQEVYWIVRSESKQIDNQFLANGDNWDISMGDTFCSLYPYNTF